MLDVLNGDWRFERAIDSGVSVTGVARLRATVDGRLAYREDGRMQLPGGVKIDAYADYLFDRDGETLRMWFAEMPPRLFQAFPLSLAESKLRGEGRHDCPPDIYDSLVVFDDEGSWRLTHTVNGPRKSYCSVTRYRR